MAGESSVVRQACAACKHQRRKCEGCLLQPFFPSKNTDVFKAAHRVFGVRNMAKRIENLVKESDRAIAMESIMWEAMAWKENPIHGPLGLYKNIEIENQVLKDQVQQLLQNQQTKVLTNIHGDNAEGLGGFVGVMRLPVRGQDTIDQARSSQIVSTQIRIGFNNGPITGHAGDFPPMAPSSSNYQGMIINNGQNLANPNFDGQTNLRTVGGHVDFAGSDFGRIGHHALNGVRESSGDGYLQPPLYNHQEVNDLGLPQQLINLSQNYGYSFNHCELKDSI